MLEPMNALEMRTNIPATFPLQVKRLGPKPLVLCGFRARNPSALYQKFIALFDQVWPPDTFCARYFALYPRFL